MASVNAVEMNEKPVQGTPVPNDPAAANSDAAPAQKQKKGGIDRFSRAFDNMALNVGKKYGRMANASPCGCFCLGMLLLVLGSLPFFYESGRGRRSNLNRGRGIAFRTDYGMWSPTDSHEVNFFERVNEKVPMARREYLKDMKEETWNGRTVEDKGFKCEVEGTNAPEFLLSLVYANKTDGSMDLCDEKYIMKIWEQEQYFKNRETKSGYAFAPDFCAYRPQFEFGKSVEAGTSGQKFREPCGPYKGKDIGHPTCSRSGDGNTCECAITPCQPSNRNGGDLRLPGPTSEMCIVKAGSKCVDAWVGANGKTYSEDACRKLNEVPVLGVPVDQYDQGYQCSKTSMISAIGLMNAVVENMNLHVDDMNYPEDDSKISGYNVGRETMTAMLNMGKADAMGWQKRSGNNQVLTKFPLRAALATYFTNALVNGTQTDKRPWCITEDRCVTDCGVPEEFRPTPWMKKFGTPAQDALDQVKNDDAGIPAPAGRRLYEEVSKKQRTFTIKKNGVFAKSELEKSALFKLTEGKGRALQGTCADPAPTSTNPYGLDTLKSVDPAAKEIPDCSQVPKKFCTEYKDDKTPCGKVAKACRGSCDQYTAKNFCSTFQKAAAGLPWYMTPDNLALHGEIDPDICGPLSSGPNDVRAGPNAAGSATPDFAATTDMWDRMQIATKFGCTASPSSEWQPILDNGYEPPNDPKNYFKSAGNGGKDFDIGTYTLDFNVNPTMPANVPLDTMASPCLDLNAAMGAAPGTQNIGCAVPWEDACSCLEMIGGCGALFTIRTACPWGCHNFQQASPPNKHMNPTALCTDPAHTDYFTEGGRRQRRLMALALEKERLMKEDPHFRRLAEEENLKQRRLSAEAGRASTFVGLSAAARAFVDDASEQGDELMSMLRENLQEPAATETSAKRGLGIYNAGRRLMEKREKKDGHALSAHKAADFSSDEERHEFMWNYAFKSDFFHTETQQKKSAENRRLLEENLISELEYHEWENGVDSEEYKAAARKLQAGATRPVCDCCNDYFSARPQTVSTDAGDTRGLIMANTPYILDQCQGFLQIMLLRPECQLDHPDHTRITRGTVPTPTLKQRDEWVQEMVDEFIENFKDAKVGGWLGEWSGVWGGYTPVAGPSGNMDGATYKRTHKIHKDMYNMNMGFTMFHPKLLSYESEEIIKAEMGALVGTFLLMVVFLICAIAFAFSWKPDLRRVLISSLVVVQPVMAALFAFGLGFLPIWGYLEVISFGLLKMPGDVDKDGEEDGVIAMTLLSPLFLHLLLAVVVDFDIIVVRGFDRVSAVLPFHARIEHAMGYVHRTILLSIGVGSFAFIIGSIVDLPVLIYFCWHSFLGMVGLYISLFTLFLGAFVLLERSRTYDLDALCADPEVSSKVAAEEEATRKPEAVEGEHAMADTENENFENIPVGAAKSIHDADSETIIRAQRARDQALRDAIDNQGFDDFQSLSLKEVISKNPRDLKFSDSLAKKPVLYTVIVLELVMVVASIIMLFVLDWLKSDFQGVRYLLPGSTVAELIYRVMSMGGFSDSIYLYLPPSSIGEYHKAENRKYYRSVFDMIKDDEIATPNGIPGTYSWLEEFDSFHFNQQDQPYALSDINKGAHSGCRACPQIVMNNPKNLQYEVPQGASAAQVAALFTDISLEGRQNFIIRGFANVTMEAADFDRTVSYAQTGETIKYPLSQKGTEIVSVSKKSPAAGLDNIVVLDQHPTDVSKAMSKVGSVANLYAIIAQSAQNSPVILSLRNRVDERFTVDTGAVANKRICDLYQPWYDAHVAAWENSDTVFYEYLHAFYEDWNTAGMKCCHAGFKKPRGNKGLIKGIHEKEGRADSPMVKYYGLDESKNMLWDYDSDKKVNGLKGSFLKVYVKYNPTDAAERIESMHRIKKILEDERKAKPERWGRGGYEEIPYTSWLGFTGMNKVKVPSDEHDSFIASKYFINTDRDEHMIHYLYDHLAKVSGAVMLGCIIFLHPVYGLAVGGMLGVINFQILGWIAGKMYNPFHMLGWGEAVVSMNYNLIYNPFTMTWMEPVAYIDLIAFGVMVMAIGFEIEYVVHIAHAFLHCEGTGLTRARNALEEMGITVFSAAASTAVQQLVLLFFASSLAFSIYPKVMMMVIVKAGLTGFIFAPGILGVIHQYAVKNGIAESDEEEKKADKSSASNDHTPAEAKLSADV
jgi:hypothetical protein